MSLGSYAALKFAIRRPQKVSKLALLTTGGIVPPKAGFLFKALLPHAEVNILADTGHAILGKSEEILRFLCK
jgi:hypothetical protein